jgi:hypothetical protein
MKGWLALLLLACALPANAEIWRFGLIGDVPYNDRERAELPGMLDAIADRQVAFIAHIGDIKHGIGACDDALFADRFLLFDASRAPFVLVPGDNEWTDCQRLFNGAHDPLERLTKLRTVFWREPRSLGRTKMPLVRQPGSHPEHTRFRLGSVLFVTLNLPGDNNHFGPGEVARPEFLARNPLVLSWLTDSFALARREQLSGIVLLFHANPGFVNFSRGLPHRGYRDFLHALRDESANFPGAVVVVHGDTHFSRIDHPLRGADGKPLRNFTRVETFGYPQMGWTLGIIDTDQPGLFRFEPQPWPARKE